MLWLQFIFSSFLIILAGVRLTTFADILGDRLNVGKVWIGIVLLGIVTSLPEAVSSLTAAVVLDAPDLAIGNMVGSNNFNICLVLVMDLFFRHGPVTNQIRFIRANVLPAVFSLILVVVVMFDIAMGPGRIIPVGFLSLGTVVVLLGYFAAMNVLSRHRDCGSLPAAGMIPKPGAAVSMRTISLNLLGSAVLVVVGAVLLANSADRIADITHLGRTFVGTFFLALVTSLPEMVVTVSAVRLGALDLAVGNIFGSNMTNMFLVGVCDLFFIKGPILGLVSPRHIVTAVSSLVLTLIVLMGMKQNSKKGWAGLGWDSWLTGALFLCSMVIMYYVR